MQKCAVSANRDQREAMLETRLHCISTHAEDLEPHPRFNPHVANLSDCAARFGVVRLPNLPVLAKRSLGADEYSVNGLNLRD